MNDQAAKKIKVLLEMRPALEGFAGIPQEVRLLFRGLRKIESVDVEGLIQTSHRVLARGTKDEDFSGKGSLRPRRLIAIHGSSFRWQKSHTETCWMWR